MYSALTIFFFWYILTKCQGGNTQTILNFKLIKIYPHLKLAQHVKHSLTVDTTEMLKL